MNFSERIEAVMRHYKLQAREMADLCGVQRTAISHILSGRNRPSVGFLSQLSEAFPELNTRWLLHGKGGMFTSVTTQENEKREATENSQQTIQTTLVTKSINEFAGVTSVDTNVTTPETGNPEPTDLPHADKRLVRIVFFYEDGTFSAYTPR